MGCCNNAVLTNPCTDPTCTGDSCSCPLLLGSICVLYDGEELLTIQAVEGDTLTSILEKIDALLNTSLNPSNLYLNIGGGVESFKQVNTLSQAEFRTFISSDASVTIVQNADTIDLTSAAAALSGLNVGTGAGWFKQKNGTNLEFKTIVSNTLDITTLTPDEVRIEYTESFTDLPRYIVNNLYAGVDELGTAAKPFKTIQAAITEYVGAGTIDAPENEGATIIIQEGNPYTFTGNLSYRNLKVVIEENATVSHAPATGGYLMDLDTLDSTATKNTLEIRSGAVLTLTQRGFRNKGSLGGASEPKEIKVSGSGKISLSGARQAGYSLIECNSGNSTGYAMSAFQNFEATNTFFFSSKKDMWYIGRDAEVSFSNCIIRHSDSGTTIDAASQSFNQTGGIVTLSKCDLFINGTSRTDGFTLTKDPSFGCTLIMDRCKLLYPSGTISNLFSNKSSSGNYPNLQVRYFTMTNTGNITNLIDSSFLWNQNLYFEYNTFYSGALDNTKADLTNNNTRSVSNIIEGQVLQSLQSFTDRTTAAGSLGAGAMFINTNSANPDTATHFIDIVI